MSCKEAAKAKVYTGRIPTLLLSFSFNVLLPTGEIMSFITLVVLTALCLVFPPTRIYAVILSGLLLYIYPAAALGVITVAGIFYFIYRRTFA